MAELPDQRLPIHSVAILRHAWLSTTAFELILERPHGFVFQAGQKILLKAAGSCREYTLASSPGEDELAICMRFVKGGALSANLATATAGQRVQISDAYGFFVYRPGRAVFIATGTGIAPFVAYAKSGVTGYALLHGVREAEELYYSELLRSSVENYIPCISGQTHLQKPPTGFFDGRVTSYLADKISTGQYDFYLCGNGSMIRDATLLIDQKFPESRLFSESFFTESRLND
jgi:benzoate/toluate 1,2-dioxygenase reductase component